MKCIHFGILVVVLVFAQAYYADAAQLKTGSQSDQIAVIRSQAVVDLDGMGIFSCALKNVSEKRMKSASVELTLKDVDGAKVGRSISIRISDLSVGASQSVYEHFFMDKDEVRDLRRHPHTVEWTVKNIER